MLNIFLFKKNKHKNSTSGFKKICNLWCRSNRYGAKKILQNYSNIQIPYFVDDDKNKIGRTIDGIRVFSPKSLEEEKQKLI